MNYPRCQMGQVNPNAECRELSPKRSTNGLDPQYENAKLEPNAAHHRISLPLSQQRAPAKTTSYQLARPLEAVLQKPEAMTAMKKEPQAPAKHPEASVVSVPWMKDQVGFEDSHLPQGFQFGACEAFIQGLRV